MTARLAGSEMKRLHQALHHLVAKAPWSEGAMLRQVHSWVLPHTKKNVPASTWFVEEIAFPKKGVRSAGVVRQEGGQLTVKWQCPYGWRTRVRACPSLGNCMYRKSGSGIQVGAGLWESLMRCGFGQSSGSR
jgi:hypothetical protein